MDGFEDFGADKQLAKLMENSAAKNSRNPSVSQVYPQGERDALTNQLSAPDDRLNDFLNQAQMMMHRHTINHEIKRESQPREGHQNDDDFSSSA